MLEIIKIKDEGEREKTKTKRNKGVTQVIAKVWELNDFVVHLGFIQIMCKASLIFNSNLELALSIILKESKLYESKHTVVERKCLKPWKNRDIVITKPDKGNWVVMLDRKFYDNAIQKIISDTSKFEKLNEDPTLNVNPHHNLFYASWNKKYFLTKIHMISCILLVLLLLVSMVLLKRTRLIMIWPVSFVISFHP